MSYLSRYITEHLTNILSWSTESAHLFEVSSLVEWYMEVPKYSSFRVNTLKCTTEEVITYLKKKFREEYSCETTELPDIRIHDVISECIIISQMNISNLDLTPKEAEVIVDPDCGVAVLRGSNVFAPGVLSMTPRTNVGSKVSVYADLEAKCLRGSKQHYSSEGKLFLGNGIVLQNRFLIFDGEKKPSGIAIKMTDPISGLIMPQYPSDFGVLQNTPSMVCIQVLDPKPGETVLDMCAAPGNKTTHIAALMNDEGILIALDRKSRIKLVDENCSKLQICNCIHTFSGDSTRITGEVRRPVTEGPPFAVESFDRVLLDAACSGSGNRPMLKNRNVTERATKSFSNVQKSLLKNAIPLLKPGGTLVYSTCSILCEENECVVAWALKNYPEMNLVKTEPLVGSPGLPNCGLLGNQLPLVQRFGPRTRANDSIGFFIAKLRKKK